MKSSKFKQNSKGYTLIELSVVLVLIVLIASTLTSMLTQQVQFYTRWNTQRFIAEEAPLANNIVVRLFAKADTFRVVNNKMVLGFVQDDGTTRYGELSYAAPAAPSTLGSLEYSYNNGVDAPVAWDVARGISSAAFNRVGNTLQFTLTGPYGGQVTYAATPAL